MTRTTEHDPKCLAHGFGPGQRMDICICVGIRIGRADEREKVLKVLTDAWGAAKASWRSGGDTYWEGRMDALDYAIRIVEGGESDE